MEAYPPVTGVTWTCHSGMFGLKPVLDPFPDRGGSRRGGRHQVVILTQAAGDTVVHDDPVLGAHHPVTDAADSAWTTC